MAGRHVGATQAQTFWLRFYECFGIRAESATIYEQSVKKLNGAIGYIDSFIPGKLIVEHKSAGKKLETAFDQASEYLGTDHDDDRSTLTKPRLTSPTSMAAPCRSQRRTSPMGG